MTALFLLLLVPVYVQDPPPPAAITPHKVKGLTLPAAILVSPSDHSKKIVPVFDDPQRVIDCKWSVIGSGANAPEYKVEGTGKDSYLVVMVPAPNETVIVLCYALYGPDKPWVTEAAQTAVQWPQGTTTPPPIPSTLPAPATGPPPVASTLPAPPNPDQVFAGVKNIHAVLFIDKLAGNAEMNALLLSKQAIALHFEQPGTRNNFWVYDIRDAEQANKGMSKRLTDAQGRVKYQLPLVVIIDGNLKPAQMIGPPLPVTLTGNTTATIAGMLNQIAAALKH